MQTWSVTREYMELNLLNNNDSDEKKVHRYFAHTRVYPVEFLNLASVKHHQKNQQQQKDERKKYAFIWNVNFYEKKCATANLFRHIEYVSSHRRRLLLLVAFRPSILSLSLSLSFVCIVLLVLLICDFLCMAFSCVWVNFHIMGRDSRFRIFFVFCFWLEIVFLLHLYCQNVLLYPSFHNNKRDFLFLSL